MAYQLRIVTAAGLIPARELPHAVGGAKKTAFNKKRKYHLISGVRKGDWSYQSQLYIFVT